MSKFIIKAGPYGNEIVLGTITKELYEKYKDDSVALRKRVTTTGEPDDLNEWFDIDDIDHVYGAQVEDADSDTQFLRVIDQDKNEIFNIPLAEDKLVKADINIDITQKHDHSNAIDLSKKYYFYGLQGEKGEWTNEDEPIEAKSFEPKKLTVHIANMDGMYALYAITYNKKKFNLNCNSPTPKLFDFQVLKGSECE